ncbi:hypothetical protein ACFL1O_00430 [Patescibacteria group bacterium]
MMTKECLWIDCDEIPSKDPKNTDVLAIWFARFEEDNRCPEFALIDERIAPRFHGSPGEISDRQAELNKKPRGLRGKKFEIWFEQGVWKCRKARKKRKNKQKQLFE